MISRHVDTAFKIADLIAGKGPPDDLRTEVMNAAQYAVRFGTARRADLPKMLHHQTKAAKRTAVRLQKALDKLQDALADPDLHESLRPDGSGIKAKRLTAWREKAVAFRDQAKAKPLDVDMALKVSAAESAYQLLKRFKIKIVMTKGSTFCQVAALLYGDPKANLQNACRIVISRWSMRKTAGLPHAVEALLRPYRVDDQH